MPGYNAPPYALDTTTFCFPTLALCAGRAVLGGDRDLVLGVFMAARLAQALLPPVQLEKSHAAGRAERAKMWLTGLTMPQPARMALLRAFDGTGVSPDRAADAIDELARIVTGHVDAGGQQELTTLATHLRLYYEQTRQTPRESHGRP